ncbi:MAG: hypothetical protein Q7U54_20565 [Bacteroidales bacterium]|nr:hypothetical protein [Bacteroidales bacterium]
MRFLLTVLFIQIFILGGIAQTKETFDLTSYIPPKGWSKNAKSSVIGYTITDKSTGSWCQIGIYKSAISKGSIQLDFENDWKELIAVPYKIADSPWITEVPGDEGWKIKNGGVKFTFNAKDATAILTTFSGYGKVISITATTNSDLYSAEIQNFISSIVLSKPGSIQSSDVNSGPVTNTNKTEKKSNISGSFAFSTTNFDDGWVATQKPDWVEVTKENLKVLIHYPNKATDEYITDRDIASRTGWNTLVAPRYSNLKNYFVFNNTLDPEEPQIISGDVTENSSGKNVFVVLFKRGKSGWIEFICSGKANFIKNFNVDQSKLEYYTTFETWEPLKRMASYNKFAVAASDFTGDWTNDFGSIQQYVNVYTGMSAGMTSYSSKEEFEFGTGSTYKWTISTASGGVGNMKFNGTNSNGSFSLISNWQVKFSDMEGKPKIYDAYFSCVKGNRILWLSDTAYPGFTAFGKAN